MPKTSYPFVEQELGQVRAVLAGDARDERSSACPSCAFRPFRRRPSEHSQGHPRGSGGAGSRASSRWRIRASRRHPRRRPARWGGGGRGRAPRTPDTKPAPRAGRRARTGRPCARRRRCTSRGGRPRSSSIRYARQTSRTSVMSRSAAEVPHSELAATASLELGDLARPGTDREPFVATGPLVLERPGDDDVQPARTGGLLGRELRGRLRGGVRRERADRSRLGGRQLVGAPVDLACRDEQEARLRRIGEQRIDRRSPLPTAFTCQVSAARRHDSPTEDTAAR